MDGLTPGRSRGRLHDRQAPGAHAGARIHRNETLPEQAKRDQTPEGARFRRADLSIAEALGLRIQIREQASVERMLACR
jgi:hypothetical protein